MFVVWVWPMEMKRHLIHMLRECLGRFSAHQLRRSGRSGRTGTAILSPPTCRGKKTVLLIRILPRSWPSARDQLPRVLTRYRPGLFEPPFISSQMMGFGLVGSGRGARGRIDSQFCSPRIRTR